MTLLQQHMTLLQHIGFRSICDYLVAPGHSSNQLRRSLTECSGFNVPRIIFTTRHRNLDQLRQRQGQLRYAEVSKET